MNQPDREAFVAALLAGELSPTDPQVEARLRAEPELRIMIERIRDVEVAAVRAASEEREILGQAQAGADYGFGNRVTEAVQQLVAERQRASRRRWLAGAALAAAAAVAIGCFMLLRTPRAPDNLQLGGDGLKPTGKVTDGYSPFVWPAMPGTRYVLSIFADAARHDLLYQAPEENVTPPCYLPAHIDKALPAKIWWKAEPQGGEPSETYYGSAWR